MNNWIFDPIKKLDEQARNEALERQQQLTKANGFSGPFRKYCH